MKKYLFIDTWNGEGYSESKAFVLEFPNKKAAVLKAHELANECASEGTPLEYFMAEDFKEKNDKTLFGYSYEMGDDAGAISVIDFDEKIVGVCLDPCVNDFFIFDDLEEWQTQINLIRNNSMDYIKEEDNVFGTLHHQDVDIPSDMLLLNREMILN